MLPMNAGDGGSTASRVQPAELGDFETRPENEEREGDWSVKDLGSRIRCIEPRPPAPPLTVPPNEQDTLLLCKWLRLQGKQLGLLTWGPSLLFPSFSEARRISELRRCSVVRQCERAPKEGVREGRKLGAGQSRL